MDPIRFMRFRDRPVFPRIPGSWKSVYTANPEVLRLGSRVLLYYRGQGDDHHDQIGVATASFAGFDGVTFMDHPSNPVIRAGSAGYDSGHVLDPAAIVIRGKVYVYYTAHGSDETGRPVSGIGVAVSDDGYSFTRPLARAVISGAVAPDAVVRDGKVWLVYERPGSSGGWDFFANSSDDPLAFDPKKEVKILSPSSQHAWEARSIITPRLFEQGGFCYMTYVGSPWHQDYGFAMGLARSRDLLRWERYPENPVFERSDGPTWDNAAIWFCTLFNAAGRYFLYYEGGGGPDVKDRDESYAGYGTTSFSQVGVATYSGPWW